jgi:hypothetical protein
MRRGLSIAGIEGRAELRCGVIIEVGVECVMLCCADELKAALKGAFFRCNPPGSLCCTGTVIR